MAKETIYGSPDNPKICKNFRRVQKRIPHSNISKERKQNMHSKFAARPVFNKCYSCGKRNHVGDHCRFRNSQCSSCKQTGHTESACFKTQKKSNFRIIFESRISSIYNNPNTLYLKVSLNSAPFHFEVILDLPTIFFFIILELGEARETEANTTESEYASASLHSIPIFGTCFLTVVSLDSHQIHSSHELQFGITNVRDLNLLGLDAISRIQISVDDLLRRSSHYTPILTAWTAPFDQSSQQEIVVYLLFHCADIIYFQSNTSSIRVASTLTVQPISTLCKFLATCF